MGNYPFARYILVQFYLENKWESCELPKQKNDSSSSQRSVHDHHDDETYHKTNGRDITMWLGL